MKHQINKILFIISLLLVITILSCKYERVTRYRAKRIGMNALYEKFGKDRIDYKKPYSIYQTDTTWVLYPNPRIRKGYRIRNSKRGPSVIINKKNGEVLKFY